MDTDFQDYVALWESSRLRLPMEIRRTYSGVPSDFFRSMTRGCLFGLKFHGDAGNLSQGSVRAGVIGVTRPGVEDA
ncbi:hypothetical protein BIV24_02585 [Streptomyces colonosanans]|uniref:Uncharacterized protein n=1 Tax=Streptomyces colonosanans TaxID=1428652 RepID=A0A1S2Q5Z3_9ACTN|nr:hypothetical protein BIV24_02585 [Streptomyces colonosanans]